MSNTLAQPIRRALAIAILLTAFGVIYYGLVRPVLDGYAALESSIAQLRESLVRYERAARDLGPRAAALAALKKQQWSQDGFLRGDNDTLVAAEIQNRIKALAKAAQGELHSTQVLPIQDEGRLRRISVRSHLSGTIEGALRIIHGIEADTPVLFIDNLDLRTRAGPRRDRSEDADADLIDVQFDVYGFTHASH